MDMGVKSMTKEPVKLAVLGVLCVVMLFAVGRTVMTVTGGGTAPAPPLPPAGTAPTPAAGGSPPVTSTTGASPSSSEPAGVAAAAIAAAHGAVTDSNNTTAGAAGPQKLPAGQGAAGSPAVAAALAAAAGTTKVAVYFPLPPDQLRNPFVPSREIQALVQPPAPPKPAPPRPPAAVTVARPPAPTFPPAGMSATVGRSPSNAPPLPEVGSGRLPPAMLGAAAPPAGSAMPALRPSPYKMAIDAASTAASAIKGQVTLKGILVGQPSTAFATVGGSEQLLHPGDAVPAQLPGGVRFKVASIDSSTMSLQIDDRSIAALSGNNRKLAAELASVRVEIRQ